MRLLPFVAAILVCWPAPLLAGSLHEAVRHGDVATIVTLLDNGAEPSELDASGEPVLIVAALSGSADVIALLLDRGTDINIRNKGGLTALHAAAYAGRMDVVEILVARGADVNDAKNFYHMTPLHGAAEEGHANVVAFLLARNVDIEAKERNGYTPLTQAGWRSHWEAADLLIKAGANCQKAEIVGEWLYAECTKRK
ncbi:ankyrin repeat domain-containing protein [Rhizobium sp. TRM96647]|uniref:ankyrin repeat domain-containing protein n=1 Tax=unclassified Rhizobium TaxID=2613769 RepID=UPI0021E82ED8|nr:MULTISPECIES: ankyrin repeat domain-containing protein [unclassified Rhizobium]MCV3739318.1 ankyrin repeat domain-containing protein [Rhizobium sp. TRM96647]MCV3760932.1 ankyrin repeat domain-containing protein [Rhizobium sp. TRM96650]